MMLFHWKCETPKDVPMTLGDSPYSVPVDPCASFTVPASSPPSGPTVYVDADDAPSLNWLLYMLVLVRLHQVLRHQRRLQVHHQIAVVIVRWVLRGIMPQQAVLVMCIVPMEMLWVHHCHVCPGRCLMLPSAYARGLTLCSAVLYHKLNDI